MSKKLLNLNILIAKEIQHMLEKEGYMENDKLPSERELADQFHAQRLTIRSALQILIQKGVIISKERQGYYVAKKRIPVYLNEFKSTSNIMAGMGMKSEIKLLDFRITEVSGHLSDKMMLPDGTKIIHVMRLRYKSNKPICIENSYLVYERVSGMEASDLEGRSMYEVIKNKFNISIGHSNQKVTVVYANGTEAKLLEVESLQPLMKHQGLVYDKKERLIEFFESIMLIDEFEFISN